MKNIIVPDDVKEYVQKNRIRKTILWLTFTAVIVALLGLFGERCFGRLTFAVRAIVYLVLILSPFFTLRMYELFDKSWCGTLKKIQIKYTTDSTRGFKPTRETLYTKETIIFHVDVGGKIIQKKVFEAASGGNALSHYYKEGDKVVHVGGTKHIQVVNNDRLICCVCGATNDAPYKKCVLCDHTLKIRTE